MSAKKSIKAQLAELESQLLSINVNKSKIGKAKFNKLLKEIENKVNGLLDKTKSNTDVLYGNQILEFIKFTRGQFVNPGVKQTFENRILYEKRRKEFRRGTRVQIRGAKGVVVPFKGQGIVENVNPVGVRIRMETGPKQGQVILIENIKLNKAPEILERIDGGKPSPITKSATKAVCAHDNCVEFAGELICQDCQVAVDGGQFFDDGLPMDPEDTFGDGEPGIEPEAIDDGMPEMKHGFNEAFSIVNCAEDNKNNLICKTEITFEERFINELLDIMLEPTEFNNKIGIGAPKAVMEDIKKMKGIFVEQGIDANDNDITAAITLARCLFWFNTAGFQNINMALLATCGSGKIFESPSFITCVAKSYNMISSIRGPNGQEVMSVETLVLNCVERFEELFSFKLRKSGTFKVPSDVAKIAKKAGISTKKTAPKPLRV